MAQIKTRTKLVDVARQLFAKNGLDNTTMNDIALASGKGRRTLYTYFKNKEDIYFAVIEEEMDRLSEKMKLVSQKYMEPEDKLVELIYTHLDLIKEAVRRNGNLRAEFFRNIVRVQQVRKNFDRNEIEFFKMVLTEGIRSGRFDVDSVDLYADILHFCVKGLEIPYIYGRLGKEMPIGMKRGIVQRIVHRALSKGTVL